MKKLLVANRSEIAIRVFRAATELGIPTVAIYAYEDRFALHRFKADEAYQVGAPGEPIRSYLNYEAIVDIATQNGVDAIHPGYGFLSEKPQFAQACADAGITFIGPSVELLHQLGDKTEARHIAIAAGVPVLGGTAKAIPDAKQGEKDAKELGYPVILKAAHGGGGRGMRIVEKAADFKKSFEAARQESLTAFGSPDVFLEKYIRRARHIEVQILGDKHGSVVHLHERDCSVQRRHQKVVEIAPAVNLSDKVRIALYDAAIAIAKQVNYQNAGTMEFLVDADTDEFYFIECNPRIQVEHTVTEEVTGIDIVRSQILIAQGKKLTDPELEIGDQNAIRTVGFALQCRVTTEDPANGFVPDYGRMSHYRSAAGMGIRLDAGTAFSGAYVQPYYDSLLVKVTARARRFPDAVARMERSLHEFRIRGVKSNIPFLHNLLQHPTFLAGQCTTTFIDDTPELFDFPERKDRATKMLTFVGETIVNGNALVKDRPKSTRRAPAPVPKIDNTQPRPPGTRDKLLELGPKKFAEWVLDQKQLLITDTTFRDAHQSLLATRMRTHDLLQIAEVYSYQLPQLFSLEMWGGATFDTTMRFLKECPWARLEQMRQRVPNILFQMLLRASNAVGYTNYPDNVVRAFVKEAALAGIDVFRIFDALNWEPNMRVAIDAVLDTGAICEAAICYSGDITNPNRTKYDLKYYLTLAKKLEQAGAHILAIKDMAGLCKPEAVRELVGALRQEVGIPIHFHTHDTAGIQAASILKGNDVGLHIADAAMAPLSGGTSQVNLNTLCESLRYQPRDPGLDTAALDAVSEYWRCVREFYTPFESVVLPGTADLYNHEMPGGQYTNLYEQARSLGLADRWTEVCKMYAEVNQLFGDIVKVTPTSKSVGDMALFLVANDLSCADVAGGDRDLAYPESVIDLISGAMGQPPGGFPEKVKQRIVGNRHSFTDRPGASLPDADFAEAARKLESKIGQPPSQQEVLSQILYPKVHDDFLAHARTYSDTSGLPTPVFFYGTEPGEEFAVDIEAGKTLIVKYVTTGGPHPDGTRTVFFELNGQPRDVNVADKSLESSVRKNQKADPDDPTHVPARLPGMVVNVAVKEGETVRKGKPLLTIEAMKMQTTLQAERDGTIGQLVAKPGSQVEPGDLLLTLE